MFVSAHSDTGPLVPLDPDPLLLMRISATTSSLFAVLALAGIDGKRRPETLTLAEFAKLTELFVSVRSSR